MGVGQGLNLLEFPREPARMEAITNPVAGTYERFSVFLPGLAAAFLLLLAGMVAARMLRTLADALFSRLNLDSHTSRAGVNEVLARLGLGKSPSYGISFLIYWFVLFIFIVAAANAVNLTTLSDLLERFMLFFPRLIASILILFGGLLFARFLAEVVSSAAEANSVPGGRILSRAVSTGILVIASITALEQIGLAVSFITAAIQIVLASAGLALALAFGLGRPGHRGRAPARVAEPRRIAASLIRLVAREPFRIRGRPVPPAESRS